MASPIKALFANDITRPIEEVIKVDQTDEEIIRFEIDEYVATKAIERHYEGILESYAETPNKPHDGVGVWVSGFFGSGKSSFAKMLGLSLENREIEGVPAAERFGQRTTDKIKVLLNQIAGEHPDSRGHLRRVHRPRDPERQPNPHRDHVPTLPREPRLPLRS